MRPLLLLLVLLLLAACSTEHQIQGQDAEFLPYLQELQSLSLEHAGQDLDISSPIEFSDLDQGIQARCKHGNGIQVDRTVWEMQHESARLLILLHEIGHCTYGRAHLNTEMQIGKETIKSSVMYISVGTISWSTAWRDHQEHYLNEFFGGE